MKFDIKKNVNPNLKHYSHKDLQLARDFSKKMYNEFSFFLKAVIIFGSTARGEHEGKGDIDIMIIVDDVSTVLSPAIVETYRIITEKLITEVSTRLHVITLKLTAFWDYVRNSDPVAVNILRDGVALIDTGFFEPLQGLLQRGRIRPTAEAVWSYFSRAPRTLMNSRWHLSQATVDLYWAVIDAAHAALMTQHVIPPSPSHVAEMMNKELIQKGLVKKKYADIMNMFYRLMKQITHREIQHISGVQYEKYRKQAEDFVAVMRKVVESKK
tara:strand:+ start:880 stop:1686 length:807 start_codon:yes stop_codon:yes gene_type:complete